MMCLLSLLSIPLYVKNNLNQGNYIGFDPIPFSCFNELPTSAQMCLISLMFPFVRLSPHMPIGIVLRY